MSEPVLCYVSEPWAYFTTQSLQSQWGDDWNDAPYEHNAGCPYEYREGFNIYQAPWEITKVAFEGEFETPASWAQNSKYSVEEINKGRIPWLRTDRYSSKPAVGIFAGITLSEFIDSVESIGGKVYRDLSRVSTENENPNGESVAPIENL